ncbi:MAG: hypothetical protein U9O94_01545 [Nanoarchaeota archaeon]|nr:hypothetical protein [Nanoarchaeota archaeon]
MRKGGAAVERRYICFYLFILTVVLFLGFKKVMQVKANYTELHRRVMGLERRQ